MNIQQALLLLSLTSVEKLSRFYKSPTYGSTNEPYNYGRKTNVEKKVSYGRYHGGSPYGPRVIMPKPTSKCLIIVVCFVSLFIQFVSR